MGWELRVEPYNSTTWPSFKEKLLDTSAHIGCGQELHLMGQQVGQASACAKKTGWKSLIMEAVPGKSDHYSSRRVGIFVSDWMGLQTVDVPGVDFEPGELVASLVEPPGFPQICVASVYIVSGKGLGTESLELLEQLGGVVAARESPSIVGSDFQIIPWQLEDTGFADEVGGAILAPSKGLGICRAASGVTSVIDSFVVEASLTCGIREIDVCMDVELNPHRPIRMVFHKKLGRLKALGYIKPPALPTDLPFGPRPCPVEWGQAAQAAQAALHAARHSSTQEARACLDLAYKAWAQSAESDIIGLTGAQGIKTGIRGATVGFHNFSLRNFILRVSNPKQNCCFYVLLTRCRISRG